MMRSVCPNCKGKGHVIDGVATFLFGVCLPVLGLGLALAERNDSGGVTRTRCNRCGGHGFVRTGSS